MFLNCSIKSHLEYSNVITKYNNAIISDCLVPPKKCVGKDKKVFLVCGNKARVYRILVCFPCVKARAMRKLDFLMRQQIDLYFLLRESCLSHDMSLKPG